MRAELAKSRPIQAVLDPYNPTGSTRHVAFNTTKGYRGEDAKEKKSTMDNYWVPGVNRLGSHGRWPSPSSPTCSPCSRTSPA